MTIKKYMGGSLDPQTRLLRKRRRRRKKRLKVDPTLPRCQVCQGHMGWVGGPFGAFLGCADYPKCPGKRPAFHAYPLPAREEAKPYRDE